MVLSKEEYSGKHQFRDTERKERARKAMSLLAVEIGSQLERKPVSCILNLYKKGDSFYLQTVEKFAVLRPENIGTMESRDILRQKLIKLLDAIEALNHNLFLINMSTKINQTVKVREKNGEPSITRFVDLDYIHSIEFKHNPKALESNTIQTKHNAINASSEREDNIPEDSQELCNKWAFINSLIYSLERSQEIIADLHEDLAKSGYKINDLIIDTENILFEKANIMIKKLRACEIDVEPFRNAIKEQFESIITY